MISKDAAEVYEFIKSEITESISPSIREICEALSIKSTSTVHKYINELEEVGLISRMDNKRRSITISSERKMDVPILGNVAAGQPITAIQEVEGYVAYSGFSGDPNEFFALNIQGDSMINAGILDGDVIICRRSPVARNGQLAVAMVDGEATVKRFYKENGHFRLHPENDDMEDMIFEQIEVLGIVVASIRRYEF